MDLPPDTLLVPLPLPQPLEPPSTSLHKALHNRPMLPAQCTLCVPTPSSTGPPPPPKANTITVLAPLLF